MTIYGIALDNDSSRAFLFESDDQETFAVTLDESGANLPCDRRWLKRCDFALGVHEAVPANIDPEPILRGIRSSGLYMWPVKRMQPLGTAQ